MKSAVWGALLALCVGVALFFEWHTDEVTVVLAVMSLLAIMLGTMKPQRSLIAGAILGYSVIAAHAVTEGLGTTRPHYLRSAISTGDWVAMAVLGLWIIAVTWFAGWLSTRLEPSHAA